MFLFDITLLLANITLLVQLVEALTTNLMVVNSSKTIGIGGGGGAILFNVSFDFFFA